MTATPRARATAIASRCFSFLCVVLILLVCHRAARAQVLVLDACMKECTEADLKAISNLRRVFQSGPTSRYLIASPAAVLEQFGGKVPLPGIQDPLLTPETLDKHLRVGIEKWNAAHVNNVRENENAAKSLGLALDEAMANPMIAYSNPGLRGLIEHAYIGRAICLSRVKHFDDAKMAIGDMVRATPESSIYDSYGTDANDAFQLARKDLLQRGVGSLTIHVDDPGVVFYFNVTGQPHRGVFAAGTMLPGLYQVFMIDEEKRSRRFYVDVPPHGQATLNVNWRRDVLFETPTSRQSRIGFTFPSDEERHFEGEYASYYSGLVPGSLVVVVGRIIWEGKEAMIGVMYGPADAATDHVGVILGTDLESAQELANFLVRPQEPVPHVIRLAAAPWAKPAPPAPAPAPVDASESGWSPTWFLVGGAAAIATGVGLYAINRDSEGPYALSVGVAGVAAVGVGFGMWLRDATAPPARCASGLTLSISASHALISWSSTF